MKKKSRIVCFSLTAVLAIGLTSMAIVLPDLAKKTDQQNHAVNESSTEAEVESLTVNGLLEAMLTGNNAQAGTGSMEKTVPEASKENVVRKDTQETPAQPEETAPLQASVENASQAADNGKEKLPEESKVTAETAQKKAEEKTEPAEEKVEVSVAQASSHTTAPTAGTESAASKETQQTPGKTQTVVPETSKVPESSQAKPGVAAQSAQTHQMAPSASAQTHQTAPSTSAQSAQIHQTTPSVSAQSAQTHQTTPSASVQSTQTHQTTPSASAQSTQTHQTTSSTSTKSTRTQQTTPSASTQSTQTSQTKSSTSVESTTGQKTTSGKAAEPSKEQPKESTSTPKASQAPVEEETHKCSGKNHDFSNSSWTVSKKPTCTQYGTEVRYCQCGKAVQSRMAGKPTGVHEYVHKTVAATCEKAGSSYDICKNCNAKTNEVTIPASGHTYEKHVTAATCTTAGSSYEECTICRKRINATSIPAKGHKWGEKVTVGEQSCVSSSYDYYVCTVCGAESEKRNHPSTGGHDFIPVPERCTYGTCETSGTLVERCTKCGEERTTVDPARGFHDWVATERVDGTCQKEGYVKYECSICHQTKTESTPITDHHWVLNDNRIGLKECRDCGLKFEDSSLATE